MIHDYAFGGGPLRTCNIFLYMFYLHYYGDYGENSYENLYF